MDRAMGSAFVDVMLGYNTSRRHAPSEVVRFILRRWKTEAGTEESMLRRLQREIS